MKTTDIKIGIADTTFSRVDYFPFVEQALKDGKQQYTLSCTIERYTVPGFKDLPIACKKLIEEYNCDIVIALGMAGPEPIDKQCSHEASLGLQQVQLMTNKHILEVFVHIDEACVNGKLDETKLYTLCKNRAYKHTLNALALLQGKTTLTHQAGTGRRQGSEDAGSIQHGH
ncbi:riboflavin synthase [Candidatus Woesearchaeota archaeon]|nr:riboflavin synthase [Candidatus Woesearchaeota archaeon]